MVQDSKLKLFTLVVDVTKHKTTKFSAFHLGPHNFKRSCATYDEPEKRLLTGDQFY